MRARIGVRRWPRVRRDRGRILVIPLLLLLIGGLLAAADPTCASGWKTDGELLQIATHDLVHEFRTAAASALADRLATRTASIPLDYLEGLARGPSPELRDEMVVPLVIAYWGALFQGELPADKLVSGIYGGETAELRRARAMAVMWFLLIDRTMGLSSAEEFFTSFLCFPWAPTGLSLDRELAIDLLRRLENLLRGRGEEIWGYRLDGSVEAIRQNALNLALVVLNIDEAEVLSQLHPCKGWFELAESGETAELRLWASWVCFLYLADCAPHDQEALLELAISGGSHELRWFAALFYVDYLAEPIISSGGSDLEPLMDLALHGESEELRDAAASSLVTIWKYKISSISSGELYELALNGETPQLRQAAGEVLEAYWTEALKVEELKISDILRRSATEAHSLEQALIIFITENTVAHPELAGAAVKPLVIIWGG
jgi:hypothetical protein